MKKIAFLLVLILTSVQLRADNWLENGDFSDGISHWYGEGKSPADYAPPDPFTKPDPLYSKGLIVPLSGAMWKKVCQDFKGRGGSGTLTITYIVSPDFAFSDKPEDYKNMPDKIRYDAWASFDSDPGSWILFISDLQSQHGSYYTIHPELGKTDVQTYRANLANLTPDTQKTVTLAFPPGKGSIIILSVDFEDK